MKLKEKVEESKNNFKKMPKFKKIWILIVVTIICTRIISGALLDILQSFSSEYKSIRKEQLREDYYKGKWSF